MIAHVSVQWHCDFCGIHLNQKRIRTNHEQRCEHNPINAGKERWKTWDIEFLCDHWFHYNDDELAVFLPRQTPRSIEEKRQTLGLLRKTPITTGDMQFVKEYIGTLTALETGEGICRTVASINHMVNRFGDRFDLRSAPGHSKAVRA